MSTVVIYIGGDGPSTAPVIDDYVVSVIAADSGLDLADAHGMMVNLIIGDFDSVNPDTVKKYVDAGSLVEEFPRDKEVTDFELALLAAQDCDADTLVVIGGGSGRLDHLMGNISVLAGEQTSRWIVEGFLGEEKLLICRPGQARTIVGAKGDCVSLVPVGNNVEGATTTGLKWKLQDEQLRVDFARGMSNELTDENASVEISSGSLAIIFRSFKTVENKK